MTNKMNIRKKICYRKSLAPLQNSNRILLNKFYIIGGLSSNTFFRFSNEKKHSDRTELNYSESAKLHGLCGLVGFMG